MPAFLKLCSIAVIQSYEHALPLLWSKALACRKGRGIELLTHFLSLLPSWQGHSRPFTTPPPPICSLLADQTAEARHFCQHICQYNCSFAFTSFHSDQNNVNINGHGPWMWKTGYQIYHSAGTLIPAEGEQPLYAQLYFYDTDNALNHRKRQNPNLHREVLDTIQQSLCHCNPFSRVFLNVHDILRQQRFGNLAIHIVADPKKDQRRYNAPTVDEIAVVIIGNDQQVNNG
jgi:hypothetical protein